MYFLEFVLYFSGILYRILGFKVEFVIAIVDTIASGSAMGLIDAISLTEEKLIKEKDLIRRNVLAYNALKLILNREKTNIELSFQGF